MRLYLVRHGKAKSAQQDPQRHLAKQGREDVQQIAKFIKPLKIKVDCIWHSDKARAIETAEIIGKAVKTKNGLQQHPGLNPGDPVIPIVNEIISQNNDIMIVGHLPFLDIITAELVSGDQDQTIVSFATSAMVCLENYDEINFDVAWMINPAIVS